jgi:hypothetical protein
MRWSEQTGQWHLAGQCSPYEWTIENKTLCRERRYSLSCGHEESPPALPVVIQLSCMLDPVPRGPQKNELTRISVALEDSKEISKFSQGYHLRDGLIPWSS